LRKEVTKEHTRCGHASRRENFRFCRKGRRALSRKNEWTNTVSESSPCPTQLIALAKEHRAEATRLREGIIPPSEAFIELLYIQKLDVEIEALTVHPPRKEGVKHERIVWTG
jgi:hypothetical protein